MVKLPIDQHLEAIAEKILKHQNLVIKASPGTGKTTRIPPYLNKHFKKIMVLEPRRLAAISASDRIASENNWQLGAGKVGYHVRFDKNYREDTEIIFLTEALLARQLLSEKNLNHIDLIILDEFHERSLWTDLCLGIIKEWQELGAKVKLIILSATLDQSKIKNYLTDCAIYDIELPTFPLEKIYTKTPFKIAFDQTVVEKIVVALKEMSEKNRENILVFLPGVGEILKTQNELLKYSFLKNYNLKILHGNLSLEEQRTVIANESGGKNIILSTNLAESSVTINNLDTVIDTGLIKITDFNIKTAVQQLNLKKISKASAEQRQGRAHRQKPGIIYKLWSIADENSMEDFTPPEIRRSDLSLPLLFLTHLGVQSSNSFKSFSWYECPDEMDLELTTQELQNKKLIIENHLTPLGEILLQLNLDYHIGLLLLLGDFLGALKEACTLTALLLEKDILPDYKYTPLTYEKENYHSDLLWRYETYQNNPSRFTNITDLASVLYKNFTAFKNNQRLNEEPLLSVFQGLILKEVILLKSASVLEKLKFAIEFAFIDKICRRRKDNKTQLFTNLATNKFSMETQIYEVKFNTSFFPKNEFYLSLKNFQTPSKNLLSTWVHFIPSEQVMTLLQDQIKTDFSFSLHPNSKKINKTKSLKYHDLTLKNYEGLEVGDDDKTRIFTSIIKENFESYKPQIPSINNFYQRLLFLETQQILKEKPLIDIDSIINQACYGENDLTQILHKDWEYYIFSNISAELQNLIMEESPLLWTDSHSEKKFKVTYEQGEAHIESKLQNFLGLKEHPCLGKSKYKVKLILLGPNGRPIQITKDLINFWKTSYPDIRKELRGRYPKHAWPEDPEKY